jgi:hypothetical protein
MNQIILPVLACGMYVSTIAQNPSEPVSGIVLTKDIQKNIVVAWDRATGRFSCFKTDNLHINGIKKGDAIKMNLQLKKVTAVSGAVTDYKIIDPDKEEPVGIITMLRIDNAEPVGAAKEKTGGSDAVNTVVKNKMNPQEPCCTIFNIQSDPLEPCCNIVSFKNNSNGSVSIFKAPKQISSTFKVGQPVYVEPVSGMKFTNAEPINDIKSTTAEPVNTMQINYSDPVNGIAIVQSSYGNSSGQMNSYGYAASSGDGANANGSSTDKWVVTPVTNMKGVLGRLNSNFPAGITWTMDIYTQADNKMVNLITSNHNIKTSSLSPGEYAIRFTGVQLENVPIKKGYETRLKAGFLNIVSDGSWDLYDAAKENIHTSNTKPQKIALPVGSYQLKLGGQFYPVEIKDGETVEL